MELNERNIIIDDSLNRIAEAGMESYITHAFCSAGECEVWYGGSQLHFPEGRLHDCGSQSAGDTNEAISGLSCECRLCGFDFINV